MSFTPGNTSPDDNGTQRLLGGQPSSSDVSSSLYAGSPQRTSTLGKSSFEPVGILPTTGDVAELDEPLGSFGEQPSLHHRHVGASGSGGINRDDHITFDAQSNDDDDDRSQEGDKPEQLQFVNTASGWGRRWQYLSYYIPVTTWLPKYNWGNNFLPDLFAGLSVGAMLTPQSMAYSSILDLPPIIGLITALCSGIIYFILGHSPVLSLGPEATSSILLGESILNLPEIVNANESERAGLILGAATAVTLLCGIVTLLFGIFRLGFVDGVFSRPVLAGFICAVGATLLLDQTPKVLGLPACEHCEHATDKIKYLFTELFSKGSLHWQTMLIGFFCIGFLWSFNVIKSKYPNSVVLGRIPHIFIMVLGVTMVSYLFDFESYGVQVIGNKGSSIPTPALPNITGSNFSKYLTTAIILAILGFVETQLVNKTITMPNTTISPNRELIALGVVHIVTSFFGGYAAYGSLTRTRVSKSVGTTSQISNVIATSIVLISMIALMTFFAYMPIAVTSGIIFFVAISLLEYEEAIFAFKTKQWIDFGLYCAMVIVTFFFGVDIGLFFAFAICLLLVIKQQNKPSVRLLGRLNYTSRVQHADGYDDDASDHPTPHYDDGDTYYEVSENASLHQAELEGILIYSIDGPLFFCNSENLKERTRRIEMFGSVVSHPSQPAHPLALRAIIFDLAAVTSIDATAACVLLELVKDYQDRGVRVVFVKLRKNLLPLIIDSGLLKLLGPRNLKRTIKAAVNDIDAPSEVASPVFPTVEA